MLCKTGHASSGAASASARGERPSDLLVRYLKFASDGPNLSSDGPILAQGFLTCLPTLPLPYPVPRYPLTKMSKSKEQLGGNFAIANSEVYLHVLSAALWAKEGGMSVAQMETMQMEMEATPPGRCCFCRSALMCPDHHQCVQITTNTGMAPSQPASPTCLQARPTPSTLPPTCATDPPSASSWAT